jgi:hypothetical protein
MTFKNSELSDMLTTTNTYAGQVLEALYKQFILAHKMTQSSNFRGSSADAFKDYIDIVAKQFISRIMDLSFDLIQMAEAVNSTFLNLEPAVDGVMNESTINSTKQTLGARYSNFENLMVQTSAILTRARTYVTPVPLRDTGVVTDFILKQNELQEHIDDMENTNTVAMQHVNSFKDKLVNLRSDMNQFLSDFSTGGRIDFRQIQNLSEQQWYNNDHGNALLAMWINDPFVYVEGHGAVWEDQWVAGDPEAFVYLGMSVLSGQGMFSVDSNGLHASGSLTGFSMTAGAESDYASMRVDARLLHVEGNARFGWSEDYLGFNLSGKAVVAAVESSVTLGQGALSITGTASVNFLTANAYAICEFESRYDFHLGIGASASVVEGEVGIQLFQVPTTNGGTTHLFGISATGGVGSVGAGANLRSQNVYQNDFLAVNVITIDGELAALLKIEGSLSLPSICFANTFITAGNYVGNAINDGWNAFRGWIGW